MHAKSLVALLSQRRLPGMNADPNLHLGALGPFVLGQSTLTRDRRRHSFFGPAERHDERIALRADLATTVLFEGSPEEPVMLQKQIDVPIAQTNHQPGRALDVAE